MKKFVLLTSISLLLIASIFYFNPYAKAASPCNITLSTYSQQIPVNKTLYLKANANTSDNICFSSSNPSVAKVDANGFVTGVSKGDCVISVRNASGTCQKNCSIKVTDSEPVKFSYCSPNNATLNSTVTLYAITDKNRQKVKFVVNGKEIISDSKKEDSNTYIWSAKIKAQKLGESYVEVYSLNNGLWQTCHSANCSIFAVSSANVNDVSLERKRISDNAVNFIAECEGYVGHVYNDHFSSSAKTIGYGYVIKPSDLFYSSVTKTESYAMLVNYLNKSGCVNSINNFLINNNIKFSQKHLDSLSSFSYNVGTAWMYNDDDLRNIIFSTGDTANDMSGTVISLDGLNLRSSPSTQAGVIMALPYKTNVTLLEFKNGWYKTKTQNGTIGYCYSEFIKPMYSSVNPMHSSYNLDNIDKNKFSYAFNMYHHVCNHAGKNCIPGLLYRRLDEMSIFFYGEYARHTYKYNPHNFAIPECIRNK